MQATLTRTNLERARGAVPALAVHALIALVLLRGLAVAGSEAEEDPPRLFDLSATTPEAASPPPPPPPDPGETESERRADPRPEGAASPPNIESRRTEIVSPATRERRDQPNAATVAGAGSDSTQGSAPERGPSSGSGGIGTGSGSGDGGSGAGGGGGGGFGNGRGLRPPRWLRGRLRDSDYPAGLGEAGIAGTVAVIYTVETDGRVTGCNVTRSSGSNLLDAHTCRLIEQRFRYDPSRDRAGRPIRSQIVENYEWVVNDLPPDEEEPPRRRRRLF